MTPGGVVEGIYDMRAAWDALMLTPTKMLCMVVTSSIKNVSKE